MADLADSHEQGLARRAWFGRIDAERSYRYYLGVSRWHRRRFHATTIVILIGTTAIVLSAALPLAGESDLIREWVRAIASGFVGGAVALLMRYNDSRTVAKAEAASEYFEILGRDWVRVWQSRNTLEENEITILVLEERMHEAPDVGVDIDEAKNERCQKEAIVVVKTEYGYPAHA